MSFWDVIMVSAMWVLVGGLTGFLVGYKFGWIKGYDLGLLVLREQRNNADNRTQRGEER